MFVLSEIAGLSNIFFVFEIAAVAAFDPVTDVPGWFGSRLEGCLFAERIGRS